jgi:hypothetical protein
MTERTRKPSASANKYLHELLAEWAIGEPGGDPSYDGAGWMDRGTRMEQDAVNWYEVQRDIDTEEVGTILTDDRLAGCSPDRLVGDDGGLEIKCPSAKVHVGYLLGEGTHQYTCQVQGSMWVTGRKWWDLLIWSPLLPCILKRHEPDEEWLAAFVPIMEGFQAQLADAKERLRSRGLEGAT